MTGRIRLALALITGLTTLGSLALTTAVSGAGAVSPTLVAHTPTPSVNPSSTPAYGGDSGDPNVIQSNGTYYDFSTGTPLGNHIQVLVDTTGSPLSGYGSFTGNSYGSSALPVTPGWEQPDTQTSPGVFFWDNRWIMYYDAAPAGYQSDTGHDCLSYATASTISPTSPVFTDSSSAPWYCSPAQSGVIDPSPFIDPATGNAYLVFKSNDGGSSAAAILWSVQLNASGTGFIGVPTQLMYNNTVANPWETTVENPQMISTDGTYVLLFSGGVWDSSSYAQGYAVCTSPIGPCTQPSPVPFLSSYAGVAGPGGGTFFQDAAGNWFLNYQGWTQGGCTSYSCGGSRDLFVTPVSGFSNTPAKSGLNKPIVGMARTSSGQGYWLVASDGGIFSYGDAHFFGSTGALTLNKPIVGMAATPDGQGYWLVASDGGIFSYGDAHFFGSTGSIALNQPIVGMTPTPSGQGYWLVASDGGIFAYGDAAFYGSTGAMHLNEPVVGMATTSGQGYWLVASDGGIFAFGDAQFHGSTGSIPLNKPIVSMARTATGAGYWLVASDGGIFAFGDAQFLGSAGSLSLVAPVVGMATSPDNLGYWMVASDGGIFSYGDAHFYGSPA